MKLVKNFDSRLKGKTRSRSNSLPFLTARDYKFFNVNFMRPNWNNLKVHVRHFLRCLKRILIFCRLMIFYHIEFLTVSRVSLSLSKGYPARDQSLSRSIFSGYRFLRFFVVNGFIFSGWGQKPPKAMLILRSNTRTPGGVMRECRDVSRLANGWWSISG